MCWYLLKRVATRRCRVEFNKYRSKEDEEFNTGQIIARWNWQRKLFYRLMQLKSI